MRSARCGDDALGSQQEGETFQGSAIRRQLRRLESLIGTQVVPLVEQADFPHVGDEEPVDLQVDRVLQGLLDGGAFAASEGPVERIAWAFAFDDNDKIGLSVCQGEPAEGGVGEFAIDLHEGFALKRVDRGTGRGADVAEQIAKHVADEIAEQLGLLHLLGSLRGQQFRPVPQPRLYACRGRRQRKGGQLGA